MPAGQQQILEMLREGKINADEAERLLTALAGGRNEDPGGEFPFEAFSRMRRARRRDRLDRHWRRHGGPRFLHIEIDEGEVGKRERLRLKVPLKLLRAGISLGGLLPREAREKITAALRAKGIDVDPFSLKGMDADELVQALSDLEMDLDGAHIRVHVEAEEEDEEEERGGDEPARHARRC